MSTTSAKAKDLVARVVAAEANWRLAALDTSGDAERLTNLHGVFTVLRDELDCSYPIHASAYSAGFELEEAQRSLAKNPLSPPLIGRIDRARERLSEREAAVRSWENTQTSCAIT